jgi:hypothetical protein
MITLSAVLSNTIDVSKHSGRRLKYISQFRELYSIRLGTGLRELRLRLVRSNTLLKPQDPPTVALLNSVFFAEPGSRIVQEIICDVFIYAVPAEMDKQHAFDLSEYQQYVRVFMTDKTSARHVFLMKLVIFCVVVCYGHASFVR